MFIRQRCLAMKPHRKKSSLDYSRARHAQKLKSKLKQMQVEATHKQNVKNIEKYTQKFYHLA